MGNDDVISAMHAATVRLMTDTKIQPHTMETGPPLVQPIERDAANTAVEHSAHEVRKADPLRPHFVRGSGARQKCTCTFMCSMPGSGL